MGKGKPEGKQHHALQRQTDKQVGGEKNQAKFLEYILMHPGLSKTYTTKEAITVVVACARNLVVLVEETGKAMKLKNKK